MILPGKTIGILGGGQLGRMLALAARRMGYFIHVLDPTANGPAGQVADHEEVASFDDIDAATRFARSVDVVTFEFENVPAETLAALTRLKPVHPSPNVLQVCRHRLREKRFLDGHGFPVAPFREINSGQDLQAALDQLGYPAILKTLEGGYDGKGQQRIEQGDDPHALWRDLGWSLGVLEGFMTFSQEISVICARAADGRQMCFGPIENEHRNHILDISTVPANIDASVAQAALDLGQAITEKLEVVGLLTIEMFVVDGQVVVNELAPRPHNSGHYSFDACLTNQFEQHIRAVCGLPFGAATLLKPAVMVNLLGDLWETGEPRWEAALRFPDVKLHLYGKHEARPGRKMGHLTALADTANLARKHALAARNALT